VRVAGVELPPLEELRGALLAGPSVVPGGPLRRSWAGLQGRGTGRDALDGISHHTLRHTGACGVSLRAVQTIGGWSTLRMVERYAHVDDAELMRAVRVTAQHAERAQRGVTLGTTAAASTPPSGDGGASR